MTILTREQATAELSLVKSVEAFDAGASPFQYTALSADDFERLNYALFNVSAPPGHEKAWDAATIMLRGADAGRDVLLLKGEEVAGVVQCKRLETAISLPAVFRELAKLILFPLAVPDLPKIQLNTTYYLSLAHEGGGTVIDFFSHPLEVLKRRDPDIDSAVREVREQYLSLAAIVETDAIAAVKAALQTIKYKLLRPLDLDGWLAVQNWVATRFFRQRLVMDTGKVEEQYEDLKILFGEVLQKVQGVPLLTDVDLKIIRERIEGTPETHRLTVGFASLFGFPREMFVGDENLRRRVGRLATLLNEINGDYIDWLFARANEEAGRICGLGEVVVTVHPFARQIPTAFLGHVAGDIVRSTLSGKALGDIIAKLSAAPKLETDDQRFDYVRARILEQGSRYLREDYSQVLGNDEMKLFKIQVIKHMMQGITDAGKMADFYDRGLRTLRPHLDAAAEGLRILGAHKPSIFLMGMTGIDDAASVGRLAASLRALEAMKRRSAAPR